MSESAVLYWVKDIITVNIVSLHSLFFSSCTRFSQLLICVISIVPEKYYWYWSRRSDQLVFVSRGRRKIRCRLLKSPGFKFKNPNNSSSNVYTINISANVRVVAAAAWRQLTADTQASEPRHRSMIDRMKEAFRRIALRTPTVWLGNIYLFELCKKGRHKIKFSHQSLIDWTIEIRSFVKIMFWRLQHV